MSLVHSTLCGNARTNCEIQEHWYKYISSFLIRLQLMLGFVIFSSFIYCDQYTVVLPKLQELMKTTNVWPCFLPYILHTLYCYFILCKKHFAVCVMYQQDTYPALYPE